MVTTRFRLAFGRHGGDSQRGHVVAQVGGFASRIGDVDVVVEDAHGESHLRQLAVRHHAVRTEASVLRRSHPRKIYTVTRTPIVLLQVAQVMGHHRDVGAPLPLQTNQHAHSDTVNAGLSHAVEGIDAPLEIGLHAARMIQVVVLAAIGFLKADYAVHAVSAQFCILLGTEGHDLNFEIREIGLGQVQRSGNVGDARLGRVFSRHEQQVFKGSKLLDGAVFANHFLLRQDGALHLVGHMEAAIDARVGAGIGQVEGNEHGDNAAEPLLGIAPRQARHRL